MDNIIAQLILEGVSIIPFIILIAQVIWMRLIFPADNIMNT